MKKHFIGIRSPLKTTDGKGIWSGQIVNAAGRFGGYEDCEVFFEPEFGFYVAGEHHCNNFADARIGYLIKDISIFKKILGTMRFAIYNLFGV